MKVRNYFKSQYLKAADLQQPVTVIIEACKEEKVGMGTEAELKPVLYFRGCKQGLVLNRTNADILTNLFGSADSDVWIGKKGVIVNDPTGNYGGVHGGMR